MRKVTLDLTRFENKISLHSYLKEALQFPFYYGANLDALHDELTSEMNAVHIIVCYPAQPRGMMTDYLPKVLDVFQDAARENYHLEIEFHEVPECC